MNQLKVLINGEMYSNDEWIDVICPTTKEVVSQVPSLKSSEIDFVFECAQGAFTEWRNTSFSTKKQLLLNWIKAIEKYRNKFVDLLMKEVAKSKKAAETEVDRSIDLIIETIEVYRSILGDAYLGENWDAPNKIIFNQYKPLGVVLAIAPFNYPVNLSISKIVPALLTGNTIVFKPASFAAGIGALLSQTIYEAKFPAGVFNTITGKGSEIGDKLTENSLIKLINFTGSTKVGKRVAQNAKMAKFIFEMGGKDPAIVLDDQDLEMYATNIIKGAFSYNGQRCTAVKRVLTTPTIAKKLVPILAKKIASLKVGTPNENADITPLVDIASVSWVMGMVQEAIDLGAKPITEIQNENNLIYPILLDNVSFDAKIAYEEPFAPILPIIHCEDLEQMISVANISQYGLQASIFGSDFKSLMYCANSLDCGSVNINGAPQRGPDILPFSGTKNSGVGTQGIKDALLAHLTKKNIVLNY